MRSTFTVRDLLYETAPALIMVLAGAAGVVASVFVASMAETYPGAAPMMARVLSTSGWAFIAGGGLLGIAAAAWWIHDEDEHRLQDGRHAG